MAGIGFNLQKILGGNTYTSSLKAHFYSAMICAGPWLLSILTLFCLSYFAPHNIDLFEAMYFKTVVIYIFAFSLIVVGVLHFPLTRYLADKLYAKEQEALIPVFNAAALVLLGVQCVIGAVFLRSGDVGVSVQILGILIYMTISLIWLIMIFLTALRDYGAIVGAYLVGSVVVVWASLGLGSRFGLDGYLAGYLAGHLVIVILWSARIFIEFSSQRIFEAEIFTFMKQHPTLVLIGFFYNLALWIDKIVFWRSPKATPVTSYLNVFPTYDSAVFFAFLTIIPALSIFLIQVETNFYKEYRRFYASILDRARYSKIRRIRGHMARRLRESAGLLLRYQGILSLLAITFAPEIASIVHMPWVQIPIFRVAVIGAFFHSLLLMTLIVILYFDFQKTALVITGFFLLTNGLLTYVTTLLPSPFYGYGYLAASLMSLMLAYYLLDFHLRRLEFFTFAPQPVGAHREEEIV